uniref:Uncharacterized protein n=1 Tax=Salix viminalis TaxID=40686 RepID=A0A6N2KTG0_SALVM
MAYFGFTRSFGNHDWRCEYMHYFKGEHSHLGPPIYPYILCLYGGANVLRYGSCFAFFWAFHFHFWRYGRDRRYLAPKGIGGFRSLGKSLFLIPYSPFIRSCRNLGSSCYTRGEEKRAVYALAATVFTGSSILRLSRNGHIIEAPSYFG